MDVTGWSQVSMTQRYQHITPDVTVAIADQVGELFWTEKKRRRKGGADGAAGVPVPA
jgi:hypothetical protein